MSRLYKISRKYSRYRNIRHNFILSILSRKFLRDGKYSRAKQLIVKALEIVKLRESSNSYLVFLIALYNISPRISFREEVESNSKKIKKKKKLLTKFDSLMFGINLLVRNYKKNKGKTSAEKLANEIIMSFYKKSLSYIKKLEIERTIVKSTAQKLDKRKKVKFAVIQ